MTIDGIGPLYSYAHGYVTFIHGLPELTEKAAAARPINYEDWGSERQIQAENLFFKLIETVLTPDEMEELEGYCLKATTEDMIEKAMSMAKPKFN